MLELNKIHHGDCLELMKDIPDKSINLIVIDPPYNIGKDKRWDKYKKDEYIEFMGTVFKECERVLKENGSFYWWHNQFETIVQLHNDLIKNTKFLFKQLIIWDKYNGSEWNQLKAVVHSDENRNYPKQAEYCLFYTFQDDTGRKLVDHDTNHYKELREYFKGLQRYIGLNKKQIMDIVGQKADHCFRWGSAQFSLPTDETYNDLIKHFNIDEWNKFKPIEVLKKEYESLRKEYESLRYTFNNSGLPSVWNHAPVQQNGHVTPKPNRLIENIIRTSSNEGDVILDCFMGSGTTAIASINNNRNFIGIEKEKEYVDIANKRIEETLAVKEG